MNRFLSFGVLGFAELYNDGILGQFLDEALRNNFELEQARLRIRRADAQLLQA